MLRIIVNFPSSIIVLPSLRLLLANRLQKTVQLQWKALQNDELAAGTQNNDLSQQIQLLNQSFPLSRVKDSTQVRYVSAIALRLAKPWGRSAMDIAQQIVTELSNSVQASANQPAQPPLDRVGQSFTIRMTPLGLIYLQLTPEGLAAWLQILVSQPLGFHHSLNTRIYTEDDNQFFRNFTSLFAVQYTYARCCSLLNAAHQEGIMTLNAPNPSTPFLNRLVIYPTPLPWLACDGSIRLEIPAEWDLLFQLLTAWDELSCLGDHDGIRSFKISYALSQKFQAFYATCRMWGEVRKTHPQLAQVRLGLVLATQATLRSVLQDLLNLPAPTEL